MTANTIKHNLDMDPQWVAPSGMSPGGFPDADLKPGGMLFRDADEAVPNAPGTRGDRSNRGIDSDRDRGTAGNQPGQRDSSGGLPDDPATAMAAGTASGVRQGAAKHAMSRGAKEAADQSTKLMSGSRKAPGRPNKTKMRERQERLTRIANGQDAPKVEPDMGPSLLRLQEGRALPADIADLRWQLARGLEFHGAGGIHWIDNVVLRQVFFDNALGMWPEGLLAGKRVIRTHIRGVFHPDAYRRASMPNYNLNRDWGARRGQFEELSRELGHAPRKQHAMHLWGPGMRDETSAGMALGPDRVNVQVQAGAIHRDVLGGTPNLHNRPGMEGVLIDYGKAMRHSDDIVVGLNLYSSTWGDELLQAPFFREASNWGLKFKPQDFLRQAEYHMQAFRNVGDELVPIRGESMRMRLELSAPPDNSRAVVTALDPNHLMPTGTAISMTPEDLRRVRTGQ